jgi:hypothetical protein
VRFACAAHFPRKKPSDLSAAETPAKIADGMSYVLFVWKPSGYELRERDGEPPTVGSEVEEDGGRFTVAKIAPSPLPADSRPCAYLQPLR